MDKPQSGRLARARAYELDGTSHLPYRPDVDGLRAVAVIAVMVYHMKKEWLMGGFTGVDVFFVISGFVVSGSLLRKQAPSLGSFLSEFYARRAKRLAPALAVMVLLSSVGMLLIPGIATDSSFFYMTAQLALVGGSNIALTRMDQSYFAISDNILRTEYNPFTHTWSLGVEEQFYFLFPLVVALAYGPRVVGSSACSSSALSARPVVLLVAVSLASLCASAVMSQSRAWADAAFYLIPSRFWQLMAGAITFELTGRGASAEHEPGSGWAHSALGSTTASAVCELGVLVCLAAALTAAHGGTGFPLPGSLPAILGAVGFIGQGCGAPSRYWGGVPRPLLNSVVGCRPMAYIGRISYPLYLWHWPVYVYFRWTHGLEANGPRAAALLATLLLALATYHGLEGRTRSWKPPKLWHVFAALALAVGGLELWLSQLRGPLFGQLAAALAAAPAAGAYVASAAPAEQQKFTQPRPKHTHHLTAVPPPPAGVNNNPSSAIPPLVNALVASAAPLQSAAGPLPRSAVCACSNTESGRAHADGLPAGVLDPTATTQCYAPDATTRLKCDNPFASRIFCTLNGQTDKCFFTSMFDGLGAFNLLKWDEGKARRCLSPDRGGGGGGGTGGGGSGGTAESPAQRRALFLLGDSTSDSIRVGVEQVAARAGFAMAHLGLGCCPWGPANYTPIFGCNCNVEPKARAIFALTTEMLAKQVQKGDVVMLVARHDVIGREGHLQWYERVALPLITARGASLVLVRIWKGPESVCNRNPNLPQCSTMPFPVATPESLGMKAFAAAHRGVHVVDLSRSFCSERGCGLRVPGTRDVGMVDDPHLNVYGSLYLAPFVCAALAKWGLV